MPVWEAIRYHDKDSVLILQIVLPILNRRHLRHAVEHQLDQLLNKYSCTFKCVEVDRCLITKNVPVPDLLLVAIDLPARE